MVRVCKDGTALVYSFCFCNGTSSSRFGYITSRRNRCKPTHFRAFILKNRKYLYRNGISGDDFVPSVLKYDFVFAGGEE